MPIDLYTARADAIGQFEFSIDGMEPVLAKSVEGGLVKASVIEEPVGADLMVLKHLSTRELEPLTVEIGSQLAMPVLVWIKRSFNRDYARVDGHVRHASFNFKETFRQNFKNALISEVTFPTLDASAKETPVLKMKIQPETAELIAGDATPLTAQANKWDRQKLWSTSAFRMRLDNGIDVSKVVKIESITVKQGLKPIYFGGGSPNTQQHYRLPEWEPTKITFPDVVAHIPLAFAGSVQNWYQKMVVDGVSDPDQECSGAIEFLAPNKSDVVFRIKLMNVGIKSWNIDKSERNDSAKKVKFELYVGQMDIDNDDGGLLSLE